VTDILARHGRLLQAAAERSEASLGAFVSPRRARRGATARNRPEGRSAKRDGLAGRKAARKRTSQGCGRGVRCERLLGGAVGSGDVVVVFFFSRAGRGVWAAVL
jgi:hypothetical protein